MQSKMCRDAQSKIGPPQLRVCGSGPLECVCRRWRQLLLPLPASLSIDLCAAHDLELESDETAAALEQLMPHLSCRNIMVLSIAGCNEVLAPHIPILLAHALYPQLRRWVLAVQGQQRCTSSAAHLFLPHCAVPRKSNDD